MLIRSFDKKDIPAILALWNGCVKREEVLYRPLKEEYFEAVRCEDVGHTLGE